MLRYTPSELRKEIQAHYKEMQEKIDEIDRTTLDLDKKEMEKMEIRFKYAHSIHQHNIKLLPQTAIIVQDVEGDLDVTDEEVLEVIRGGKRKDDTNIRIGR
jgi:UDP-N-acetylenolpyruvoylglucosamine reductase